MYYELTDHFIVRAPLPETWAFFSSAENLAAITPPWLRFTLRTGQGVEIREGSLLDYTIRWLGIPIRWRTKIIEWEPPTRFADLQVRGPYALWLHVHTFRAVPEGVECTDRVIYRVPLPLLGRMVNAAIVRRQLLEIFRYRRTVIGQRLGWVRAVQQDVEIRRL